MAHPLRVLIVGDCDGPSVIAELRRGGFEPSVEHVHRRDEFEREISGDWALVISDIRGEDFDVIQALECIRNKGRDLPLIVVASRAEESEVPEALKAGAADYLVRSNLARLNAAVERELKAAKARAERIRLEEQFQQAQKMEAVGRLAGGVAHDFNNLLTIITGYADLLLTGGDLKEPQRTALQEIRRSAERGGQLTHQLLAFSRRQPLQPRNVRVNDLLLQIEKMLRRLIGEDIALQTIPAASMDLVRADAGRLEQVIMNLVVNARDAMPDGGTLTIETGTVQLGEGFSAKQLAVPPGQYVTISIIDTGSGMDEETQRHVFEPFFTTKGSGRGTGLGLATAYGIIRQSGGAIQVISELGAGTTARIYLPFAQQAEAPQRASEAERPAQTRGVETILVVEDEARVRKLVVGVLASRGYTVLEAMRGEEALRLLRSHKGRVDLAVVDVVMPEMSGPNLVKRIEKVRPGLRVLYMSGYTDEAVVHHGIPDSGAAFLQKPFLPDALARKVRDILDSSDAKAI
jgi:two-component system, cell cycle sensor histidine kinase and response regulator CckA